MGGLFVAYCHISGSEVLVSLLKALSALLICEVHEDPEKKKKKKGEASRSTELC